MLPSLFLHKKWRTRKWKETSNIIINNGLRNNTINIEINHSIIGRGYFYKKKENCWKIEPNGRENSYICGKESQSGMKAIH